MRSCTTTRLAIAIGLGGALALPLAGCAGDLPEDQPEIAAVEPAAVGGCPEYGHIDRTGDGLVDRAEYAAFRDRAFADWDTDDDGFLSDAEFSTCYVELQLYDDDATEPSRERHDAAERFAEWDADADRRLTRDEFWTDDEFAVLDENRDGWLTAEELVF